MPPTSVKISTETDALYRQVQHRLTQNGDWDKYAHCVISLGDLTREELVDRLQALLTYKLNETGWTDDLKHRSKERARVMDPLSFQTLFAELSPQAQASIPLAVKRETIVVIQQYLEKQFES